MSQINAKNLINVPHLATGDVTERGYKFSADIEKDREYLDQISSELDHFSIREDILTLETEIQSQHEFISETDRMVNAQILKSGTCTRMGYIFGDYEDDKAYLEELQAIVEHRAIRRDIAQVEELIAKKEVEHGLTESPEYDTEEYTEDGEESEEEEYEDEDEEECECDGECEGCPYGKTTPNDFILSPHIKSMLLHKTDCLRDRIKFSEQLLI